ncbi:hypothetical protein A6E05_19305 [Aliivibrio sp. 1S165]|uniref:hypothetical protein n=1 Tax=unclassified Aliivibrio TaxID=2645654 RepID=UPI00080EA6EF|nr:MULTISPECIES: hypothetical protein [unclassified Aliivibrio]OCH13414.1 hypothetical protein A6E05_19305 [Aliivibrio sp. 1S165]OCH29388.1 hypothetical protein A6E06_19360 [Aliivibrio sp. 1S175]
MKTALHYNCPRCTGDSEIQIKEIDKLKKDNKIVCSICGGDLTLNEEGIKVAHKRFDDFKALMPYQLGVSGIVLLSTLLHFSGIIPTVGMIVGYLIAGGLFLKVQSTQFPEVHLTFQDQ